MTKSIADLRKDYAMAALNEADVDADPIVQFEHWLNEAIKAELPEPTAMNLATVSADGRPAARIVLLKISDARGFAFFTNYDSDKGKDLAANPWAALTFHWVELERQVRISGKVEKALAEESDQYFYSRPRLSRIGASASPQSKVISDRGWLERQFAAIDAKFQDDVPRPLNWGGYRVVPDNIEFWQGRRSRLHDRLVYRRSENGAWNLNRLAP